MEDHGCQQEADTLGSAVNSASQAASLAGEMEIQVESQEVVEDILSHLSNGLLGDTCKHRIAQFLEERCSNAGCAI